MKPEWGSLTKKHREKFSRKESIRVNCRHALDRKRRGENRENCHFKGIFLIQNSKDEIFPVEVGSNYMVVLMDRVNDHLIWKSWEIIISVYQVDHQSTCLLIWRGNKAVDEVRKKTTGLNLEILEISKSECVWWQAI